MEKMLGIIETKLNYRLYSTLFIQMTVLKLWTHICKTN